MRLYRAFPWDPGAPANAPGGALYLPRAVQGEGRHDNPRHYGALYLSERPESAVAEQLLHLRGLRVEDGDLERGHRRLALAVLEADLEKRLWDLDEPRVLVRRSLRPSEIATLQRQVTQRWALGLFRSRPQRAGIRWWSVVESSWLQVTLFDRALRRVELAADPEPLRRDHPAVMAAAQLLNVAVTPRGSRGRSPPAGSRSSPRRSW